MTTKIEKNEAVIDQSKVVAPQPVVALQQIGIINGAVEAFLSNQAKVDVAKNAYEKTEGGLLSILTAALKDYQGPMTEEVWDKMFKANVTAIFTAAKGPHGEMRYANPASRDVMTNLFKVATMGLTLAKIDPSYQATSLNSKNLKKYVESVRPKLQAAIDPATGKPRLKSNPPKSKAPKNLPEGSYYWLIGIKDAEKGLNGPCDYIGAGRDFGHLKAKARNLSDRYEDFFYLTSGFEVFEWEPEPEAEVELAFTNTSVSAQTISEAA
jgi:hypothetical protein